MIIERISDELTTRGHNPGSILEVSRGILKVFAIELLNSEGEMDGALYALCNDKYLIITELKHSIVL